MCVTLNLRFPIMGYPWERRMLWLSNYLCYSAHWYFMVANDITKRLRRGGCLIILLVGVGGEKDKKFFIWLPKSVILRRKVRLRPSMDTLRHVSPTFSNSHTHLRLSLFKRMRSGYTLASFGCSSHLSSHESGIVSMAYSMRDECFGCPTVFGIVHTDILWSQMTSQNVLGKEVV